MRRLLLTLWFGLLAACPSGPTIAYAQLSGSRTTVTFLPRAGDAAAGPTCTGSGPCTANWVMLQGDPATATAFAVATNGTCEVATTQGGTAPTTFDVFLQNCPNGNCTLTTGDWDDYARFQMGTGSSKHVIGWTNAGACGQGHALCTGSTAQGAGACCSVGATCLPPDCARGYYWGDRVRVATVLTGGDGTTTETFTVKCWLTGTQ